MKNLFALAALLLGAAPVFSQDISAVQKQLPALGVGQAQFIQPGPVPAPGGETDYPDALRAEALADPAAFIDAHAPAEVALALCLPQSRFVVTDKGRIERALVKLTVDLGRQRLVMQSSGTVREFRISSGLPPDHATPGSGKCFAPDFLEEMHYSSLYNKAPMPHSVFFNGNIAMHGTGAEQLLGRAASHGCVRLSRADAETVYHAVKASGKANAVICVTGVTPEP